METTHDYLRKLGLLLLLGLMILPAGVQAQRKKKKIPPPPPPVQTLSYDEPLYQALDYRLVGPFRGGRSCAVTGVPGKPNLFYFGSTGGGVWRTMDGGSTWENISDGYFGGSIGAVAVSEYDPNVIYVGGGEKTVRGNVSYGYGMWKSEDAGKTWQSVGLTNSRHIGRIRVHPKNPNLVYAAVMGDLYKSSDERGVYRSTDGGDSWEKVLFSSADAGAVDLVMDPNNPRIMFASTWEIRRTPYSLSSGGPGSALWKSTDGGSTWEKLSDKKGMPKGTLGIIGVAVSHANSERVWAQIEADKGGLYRSDDGGETWSRVNESRALRQRAWYYTRVYADTKDEDVVYVLNVRYHKSTDGGRSFKPYVAPHGDHHDLWIAPEDPSRMIIGDDGGAQISFDGGENWSTYYNQPTAQFYRVTTDNHFPYRIYAAQQDNSTIRIAHRTNGGSIGERDWEPSAGGESAHLAIDPTDNDIVFGGSYGGFLTRVNHRTQERQAINVWPDNPMGYGVEFGRIIRRKEDGVVPLETVLHTFCAIAHG
ncbi:MAG: glycosyl hydrolase, partial [Bacteroidota bacterium]